ncbi:MAG: TadG family pilus assembly protein [Alcanivorax sp.]|nr:TadG family pilus assembly protein [Alcanivorax sp.]
MTAISKHSQKGVIALATPFIILLILALTVFLLDGARLYAAKTSMQSIVDAAAAAAADRGQACDSLAAVPTASDMQSKAEAAAKQSGWDGKGTITVISGVVAADSSGPDKGVLTFRQTPILQSNAVAIRYTRPHNISLLLGGLGTINLETRAVAKKELQAGLAVESYTASLDTTQSALLNLVVGGILQYDGGLALNGVSFDSLTGVMVNAEDLVANLTGGTTAGDILASDVTAQAVLGALKTTSDATGPAAAALDAIADAAVGSNTNIALADIVNVAGEGRIPADAKIPVLSVITSTVFNLGKTLPDTITVDLADSGVLGSLLSGIAGLNTATIDLNINEAPGFIFAPARQAPDGQWYGRARSADITLTLHLGLDLDLGIASLTADLPLTLQTGSALVQLVGARCAAGADAASGNDIYLLTNVTNSLFALSTDTTATVTALGITVAKPEISADSGNYGGGGGIQSVGPFNLYNGQPLEQEFGDSGAALSNAVQGLTSSLSIKPNILPGSGLTGAVNSLLGGLANTVSGLLVPLLDTVGNTIVDPLVKALGLSLGSAKLTVTSAEQSPVVVLENVDF